MKDIDPTFLLREGAQRFTAVSFQKLLIEMLENNHAPGTIAQGKWWAKNLEAYMKDGTLPRKRDADPRLQISLDL